MLHLKQSLKYGLCALLAFANGLAARAQYQTLLSHDLATLQVLRNGDWRQRLPLISLTGGDEIQISFDDFSAAYRRFTYDVVHCEADWTPSTQLFATDYAEGFTEALTIDDVQPSRQTQVAYTHYAFALPNAQCRLTKSGNYEVRIYDERHELMARACFMVTEATMKARLTCTTNTDVDVNATHQQIAWAVDFQGVNVTQPDREIKTVVLQNGRWDDARINVSPQMQTPNGLAWQHCRALIFDAGNVYRKFECLAVDHPTMGIAEITWDGRRYHARLHTDEPRPNYVYNESAQGLFCVRNSDNRDNAILSDYVMVHFSLQTPLTSRPIYLNGHFTGDRFSPTCQLHYNETAGLYEACLLLKQGYYSYQYLTPDGGGRMVPVASEGNFYQTKNFYHALVYYRGVGERTGRLVAVAMP